MSNKYWRILLLISVLLVTRPAAVQGTVSLAPSTTIPVLSTYTYLADGTKYKIIDAAGNGRSYIGPFCLAIEKSGSGSSAETKAYLESKGIAYVEKTGNTNDEVMTAAASLVGQVDAVFTPTDNVVMAAAAAVSDTLTKGGIPFYTGADSFVTAGAFATCGVNYTDLGTYTADMALDILETGTVPAYHVMDGGIITVNTETAAALGIDYAAFNELAGQVVEVTTAE